VEPGSEGFLIVLVRVLWLELQLVLVLVFCVCTAYCVQQTEIVSQFVTRYPQKFQTVGFF
jgi:hypothetical protein